MNYTDDQLKQLLALMLPETAVWTGYILCENGGEDVMSYGRKILDTELLHLCSLVEAGLTENQKCQYICRLEATNPGDSYSWNLAFATWQQQTRALAEVKAVTL